jgi:hypothetical protein
MRDVVVWPTEVRSPSIGRRCPARNIRHFDTGQVEVEIEQNAIGDDALAIATRAFEFEHVPANGSFTTSRSAAAIAVLVMART